MAPDWMGPAWRFRDPGDTRDVPEVSHHRAKPKRDQPLPGIKRLVVPAAPWTNSPVLGPTRAVSPRRSRLAAWIGWPAVAAGFAVFPLVATAMVIGRIESLGNSGSSGFSSLRYAGYDDWSAGVLLLCLVVSHAGGITAQILDEGRRSWGAWAVCSAWAGLLLSMPFDWFLALLFGVFAGP